MTFVTYLLKEAEPRQSCITSAIKNQQSAICNHFTFTRKTDNDPGEREILIFLSVT